MLIGFVVRIIDADCDRQACLFESMDVETSVDVSDYSRDDGRLVI